MENERQNALNSQVSSTVMIGDESRTMERRREHNAIGGAGPFAASEEKTVLRETIICYLLKEGGPD